MTLQVARRTFEISLMLVDATKQHGILELKGLTDMSREELSPRFHLSKVSTRDGPLIG